MAPRFPKFRAEYYVRAYRLAKDGMSVNAIANNLGIDATDFAKMIKAKPALDQAIKEGRAECGRNTYKEYRKFAYGRLSPKARKLWDRLEEVEKLDEGKTRRERQEAFCELVATQGLRLRQQLYMHSLIATNFQVTMACQRIGLSVKEVEGWMEDRAFAELVRGINDCKKDFFESSLINLVRQGDTAATIFANKTVNRDRGYSERIQVDVNSRVEHRLNIDGLNLSVQTKRELLDALRRQREGEERNLLEDKSQVRDAEFEVKDGST